MVEGLDHTLEPVALAGAPAVGAIERADAFLDGVIKDGGPWRLKGLCCLNVELLRCLVLLLGL
eukprot:4871646-Lingulodinium_polyedra.AAC.1